MKTTPETSFEEFRLSTVAACFAPTENPDEYHIKMHTDCPECPSHMVGSVGDAHGRPETFRLVLPTPLAVGDRGTVITLTHTVLGYSYPTFTPQFVNVDGYHVIPRHYGAPSSRVGRLVAIVWLPRPAGTTEVDHLDGNPTNDALENLEWVSHSVNLQRGRHSRPQDWLPEDQVLMVHEGYEPLLTHPSKIASITDSQNTSHVLRRGTRRSIKGWYLCMNPTRTDALNFVKSLPFQDTSYYMAAVKKLLDYHGIN